MGKQTCQQYDRAQNKVGKKDGAGKYCPDISSLRSFTPIQGHKGQNCNKVPSRRPLHPTAKRPPPRSKKDFSEKQQNQVEYAKLKGMFLKGNLKPPYPNVRDEFTIKTQMWSHP